MRPRRHPLMLMVMALALALGVTASSDAAAPRVTSVAAPRAQTGPRDGIYAPACAIARACFLLGDSDHGTRTRLDRFISGQAIQVGPPVGENAFSFGLDAMSCPTTRFCMAVGQTIAQGRAVPAAAEWTGTAWRRLTIPAGPRTRPSIENSQPRDVLNTSLQAVSCASVRMCVAVGRSVSSGADRQFDLGVIRRWTGERWIIDHPARARNDFGSVACGSPRLCVLAGGPRTAFTVPESFDGRGWTLVALPTIQGAGNQGLAAVSCPTATQCVGVGSAGVSVRFHGRLVATYTALVADDQNGRWTTQRLPLAPGIAGHFSPGSDGLATVACAPGEPVSCIARGGTAPAATSPLLDESPAGRNLAHLGADGWTQSSSPVLLADLACASATVCIAPARNKLELFQYSAR